MKSIGFGGLLAVVGLLAAIGSASAEETSSTVLDKINGLGRTLDLLVGEPDRAAMPVPKADLTVVAIGSQWKWTFRYEDAQGKPLTEFTSDTLVLPVDRTVQLNVTSTDVIHEFSVPAFAVGVDGVPGRLATTWFKPLRVGTYFGQCSTTCGSGFGDMAVSIRVVAADEYAAWMAAQGQ